MSAAADSIDSVVIAAQAADAVKAMDIVAFDVSVPVGITDAFLVASGASDRQVRSIAAEIEKQLYLPKHLKQVDREGAEEGRWVLLDYGDFVAHVMLEETRKFYDLERLWKDCPVIDLHLEHPEASSKRVEQGESQQIQDSGGMIVEGA